jgi:hypothetical protein
MTLALWFLTGLATLNVIASGRSVLDDLSTPKQKLLQLVFIWLVPVAGALFTLSILRNTSPRRSSWVRRYMPASLAAAAYGTDDRQYSSMADWNDGPSDSAGDGGGGGGGGD